MAIARIPNQGDFPIDDSLLVLAEDTVAARAQRDSLVRHALSFAPIALNAELSYIEEKGVQVVVVTPRLGKKALFADSLADFHTRLRTAPFSDHPALSLALELHWRLLDPTTHPAEILLLYGAQLAEVVEKVEFEYARPFEEICRRLRNMDGCSPSNPCAGF